MEKSNMEFANVDVPRKRNRFTQKGIGNIATGNTEWRLEQLKKNQKERLKLIQGIK